MQDPIQAVANPQESPAVPAEAPLTERLERIEHAVDALSRAAIVVVPPIEGAAAPPGQYGPLQLIHAFKLTGQMFVDPRYKMSRLAKYGIPIFFVLLVLNYLLFNWLFAITLLSPVAERLVILALAAVGYRILSRELARYQVVLDYLAQFTKR